MKTLLIGDVHGRVSQYHALLRQIGPNRSIQLGDFGFWQHHAYHRLHLNGQKHKVLLGNHDDISALSMRHTLADYGNVLDAAAPLISPHLFYVRGADSIDKQHRTEGIDWWPGEELSYTVFQRVINQYERLRPRIMLSHDCPQSVRERVFGINDRSRTSQALQVMLEIHQPELWVFGHHHRSIYQEIAGTTFRCLNELETMWIDC